MLKNNSGQTTIEYILILIVIITVYAMVLKNPRIKQYMSGGAMIEELATYMQYCYRHALPGNAKETYPAFYQSATHASYSGGAVGTTRFFGPRQGYP
jgi:hypothetical protein